MGEINIIARRLSDKYIEYGYCGGGTFAHTGLRIMTWYSKRKMKEYPQYEDIIDYLFSLGETKLIGCIPRSKKDIGALKKGHSAFKRGQLKNCQI